MGRSLTLALASVATVIFSATAVAKPPHKPPKPPKPKLALLTGNEQGVLRRDEIKIGVEAKRADKVAVSAHFVVDGYPTDYPFHLGPRSRGVSDGDTVVRFKLSPRQHEVLDFAIKSCHGATLAIRAQTPKRSARLNTGLKLPTSC